MTARSPVTGEIIARVESVDSVAVHGAIARAANAFRSWRSVPAPRRGELVRLLGEELRAAKTELAHLVTIEAGKITT
ncbi:MAG: aldehyde dehydrogenase family protein, partial [Methylocystis sp.]